MLGNFNEEAQLILLKAKTEMSALNHPYIGTEHLILSILKNEADLAKKLSEYGLTYDTFKAEILSVIGKGSKKTEFFLYTPLLKKVIENALMDAKDNNNGEVTPEHLLASMLEEGEGIAIRILIGMDIDVEQLYDEFASKLVKKKKKRKKKLIIDDLGVDLVLKAKEKKLDPVIGRDKEIKRLIEILCRRTKNNPILIGDAGVGKTAIVEELANLISQNEVPLCLQDKRIISLDMASLVSGTKYRGEFEERMQKIIKEVSDEENIILFIDEIHTLVGAGGAEGAIDASNILKPALARGTIKCIGATTTAEYKKYIEDDKALDRRFQQIIVEEPTVSDTINILTKVKSIYEEYHHVAISDSIIKLLVELADKYIHDRHNPDKSLDILDEASSMVSIGESKYQKEVTSLKKEIETVQKSKTSFILENNMSKAYNLLKKESKLSSRLNKLELERKNLSKSITKEDIAMVINQKTNIPLYEIIQDTSFCLDNLRCVLKSEVVGQDKAIDELVSMTKKIKMGYANQKVKSFLFVGPTGVGKTNLAKIYAKEVCGENNFIRLDMSEFADLMSVNKIIGSAPGYAGYDDNKNILEKIKDKPTAVILFDEIDKAHPKVINLLYQILDEGIIKDALNNEVNLNNNIVIMTSNLGFEETRLGFNSEKFATCLASALRQKFSPALINRIDRVITFNYLTQEDVTAIVKNKLKKLKEKYPSLVTSPSLVKEIVSSSEYAQYGARQIDKIIDTRLESIIIDKIIASETLNISHLTECQNICWV